MAFSILYFKYVFIAFNSFNILGAIFHIILSLFINPETFGTYLALNYFNMVLSAVFCVAAVIESSWLLEVTACTLISEIISRIMLWIFLYSFLWTSIYFMIFQGIVSIMAFCLSQKLRDKKESAMYSLCRGERFELNEYPQRLTR